MRSFVCAMVVALVLVAPAGAQQSEPAPVVYKLTFPDAAHHVTRTSRSRSPPSRLARCRRA